MIARAQMLCMRTTAFYVAEISFVAEWFEYEDVKPRYSSMERYIHRFNEQEQIHVRLN